MVLTDEQEKIMSASGPMLVIGGPGSGKTTVSILKAAKIVEEQLKPAQRLLFLSFARASVSRVVDAMRYEHRLVSEVSARIEADTYHSFFWRIIQAHGYLIGLPRNLDVLTPPAEAIALSTIRNECGTDKNLSTEELANKRKRENEERERLAFEEGRVCFDLFARFAVLIVTGSARIRRLLGNMHPVIILDEFQDTNGEQWDLVRALHGSCQLIALADPEQRIYDWIGADPKRLDHFRSACQPEEFDLRDDNHRSAGTDIALFGNHVLEGIFRKEPYLGVEFVLYEPNQNTAYSTLITTLYAARTRLLKSSKKNWSLAVLVPTKKMTRLVSDQLREPPGELTPINHTAAVELEGAILGAEVIARLMHFQEGSGYLEELIGLLCNYLRGRRGDRPSQTGLKSAVGLENSYEDSKQRLAGGKETRKGSLFFKTRATFETVRELGMTGDPDHDWRQVRSALKKGSCQRCKMLGAEVRNLRLLGRGMKLRQLLSEEWRQQGCYRNALTITRASFLQEHFSIGSKPETGVVVMNMHKAKGKQFDEVIIFEGWPRRANGKIVANTDRIIWSNSRDNDNDQSRQNLRVSITRGKTRTTILTPKGDPCVLLLSRS